MLTNTTNTTNTTITTSTNTNNTINTINTINSFTYTGYVPVDTKIIDSFEKIYIEYRKAMDQYPIPQIKNVIFNPPATIVFWTDGTKTVVKCQNDEVFDPEKGITMAFFKKTHGNKGHYFEEIKKWTKKSITNPNVFSVKRTSDNHKWHIWYKIGMLDEIHCYEKDYSTKSSAVRRAKKLCECDDYNITIWTVSQKAPFGPESDDVEWHLT